MLGCPCVCKLIQTDSHSADLCLFLMQGYPRAWRSRPLKIGFRLVSSVGGISLDFLNLLMILWSVGNEISKFFVVSQWESLLNYWPRHSLLVKTFSNAGNSTCLGCSYTPAPCWSVTNQLCHVSPGVFLSALHNCFTCLRTNNKHFKVLKNDVICLKSF